MHDKKITLLPFGLPAGPQHKKERFQELLLFCGADLARIHEPPSTNFKSAWRGYAERIAAFVSYASRLAPIKTCQPNLLVVLTETCPIDKAVLYARQELTAKLPALGQALWVIYTDPDIDPSFGTVARALGAFDPPGCEMDKAPYWTEKRSLRTYLVLTPDSSDAAQISQRARLLGNRSPPSSRSSTTNYRIITQSGAFKP